MREAREQEARAEAPLAERLPALEPLPACYAELLGQVQKGSGEVDVVRLLKQAEQEDDEDGRREELEQFVSERSESGLKGVHKTGTGRWQTQVYYAGQLYHVGAHDNTKTCARTYAVCQALIASLRVKGLLRETARLASKQKVRRDPGRELFQEAAASPPETLDS